MGLNWIQRVRYVRSPTVVLSAAACMAASSPSSFAFSVHLGLVLAAMRGVGSNPRMRSRPTFAASSNITASFSSSSDSATASSATCPATSSSASAASYSARCPAADFLVAEGGDTGV
jgi:hypothetical protein